MSGDLVIRNGTVVLPELGSCVADVSIADGKVKAIGTDLKSSDLELQAEGCLVLPGFVDPHLHLGNFTAFKDDCETESRAAAHGGVTTMLTHIKALRHGETERSYMPILDEVRSAIGEHSLIDIGVHLAMSTDEHIDEIPQYYARGVRSFKFYMGYRGNEQARRRGSIGVSDGFIYRGMKRIADLDGAYALVHCENDDLAQDIAAHSRSSTGNEFLDWAATRPPIVEAEAVQRAALLAGHANCPFYIVHLSSSEALTVARRMRSANRSDIAIEVNLHHLIFTQEEVAVLEPTSLAKVYPPIRQASDRAALWQALVASEVQTVATDHCCIDFRRKFPGALNGDPGFPSLDYLAPIFVTAAREQGVTLQGIVALTSYNSARIFGLYPQKGTLLPGSDGDVVVLRPGEVARVDAARNYSASKFSPYHGRVVNYIVQATVVRGNVVYSEDSGVAKGVGGILVTSQGVPDKSLPVNRS